MPNTVFTQWEKHISTQITLKQSPKSRVTNSNAQGAQGRAEIGEADGRGVRAASPRAHSSPQEDGQCWTRVVSPSHFASQIYK